MKLLNKISLLISLVAITGSSCKKSWFDVNKDPNRAVESNITPDLITPQAMLNTANRAGVSFGFLGNWLGYWCPAANYAPNTEEQSYNVGTGFGAGLFSGILDNTYDYIFMENKAKSTGQGFYEGIAKIMKSHNFAQLVDIYNNVPYTEALKGLEIVRPKYDDGKAIYEDLIKQIDTAITKIKTADLAKNINITTADAMFGGDKTLWIKFANTLKLRLLLHQAGRTDRQAYIQAEIAKIVAEGSGFLGSGHDAAVDPVFQSDKPNSFYANFGFNQAGEQATDFWRANIVAMNYLKNNNDPRLGYFYKKKVGIYSVNNVNQPITSAPQPFNQPGDTSYRGNQYGLPINNTQYPVQTAAYVSQVGGITKAGAMSATSTGLVKGYNQPMWIMTSVESLFLQAEAIQRGYLSGNAETAYKNAVKESFIWLNVETNPDSAAKAFDKYYAAQAGNGNVDWAAATDKLRVLFFQKYLALNGTLHLETWNDFRKMTGGAPQQPNSLYPILPLSVNPGRTSSVIPVRLLYPQREIDLNTANIPSVGTKTSDVFTGKIWWMP